MNLEEKINEDLKQAMRAKDQARLRGLRAIKSAVLLAKTEKGGAAGLTQEQQIQLLQKLVKQRKDSLQVYEEQNREDLAVKEREEIAVIEDYLPKQLSDEELESDLKAIIEKTGASSPQDMGKVMGMASKQLAGKADNKRIAEKVKEMLSR